MTLACSVLGQPMLGYVSPGGIYGPDRTCDPHRLACTVLNFLPVPLPTSMLLYVPRHAHLCATCVGHPINSPDAARLLAWDPTTTTNLGVEAHYH
eukprot:356936-Chlamydomonas_euryale.AAC.2